MVLPVVPARPSRSGADAAARVAMVSVHGCPLDMLGSREVGGMQLYVRELSRELARLGVSVDVFTRKTRPDLPRVVAFGERARVVHLDAGPQQRIDKNTVVQHLPAFIENLERFNEREGIRHQVVHSHYWLSGWVGQRLGELWRIPHVTMFHTLGRIKNYANTHAGGRRGVLETSMRIEIERRVSRGADAIVASTEAERQSLVEQYGARAERIAVMPPGVDLQLFAPVDRGVARAALGLSGEVLLFVGRIDPVKGLDTLLEAIALLRHRPGLQLLVAGGAGAAHAADPDEAHLRGLARKLGVADRVLWLGPVEQERLPLYYSGADVCVVPSRYESFGLVALEALACGAALVASRVGGLPSIVRDGENGLLVPWRTPAEFAGRIEQLLNDPELAARLRRAARPSMARFSWAATARRVIGLYDELSAIGLRLPAPPTALTADGW
ncbi:MAG TPA: glycosyltransferase [Chloroflexota bacterium]|jgi:D-inositol-3-phosphate glycosyltransferase